MMLYRIIAAAQNFPAAAVDIVGGRVARADRELSFMIGWSGDRFWTHAARRRWIVAPVLPGWVDELQRSSKPEPALPAGEIAKEA